MRSPGRRPKGRSKRPPPKPISQVNPTTVFPTPPTEYPQTEPQENTPRQCVRWPGAPSYARPARGEVAPPRTPPQEGSSSYGSCRARLWAAEKPLRVGNAPERPFAPRIAPTCAARTCFTPPAAGVRRGTGGTLGEARYAAAVPQNGNSDGPPTVVDKGKRRWRKYAESLANCGEPCTDARERPYFFGATAGAPTRKRAHTALARTAGTRLATATGWTGAAWGDAGQRREHGSESNGL